MTTNINDDHRAVFARLLTGDRSFDLFSCFANSEPTAAIVLVEKDGDEVTITPMFVAVTPMMKIVDHDGVVARPNPSEHIHLREGV